MTDQRGNVRAVSVSRRELPEDHLGAALLKLSMQAGSAPLKAFKVGKANFPTRVEPRIFPVPDYIRGGFYIFYPYLEGRI
ncbi:hypothetical protein N752_01855 [Desulforamulus aquiferis]|nr:hypothetical protein N752_01855 [Desulforamulus aquiferis]